MDKCLKSAREI